MFLKHFLLHNGSKFSLQDERQTPRAEHRFGESFGHGLRRRQQEMGGLRILSWTLKGQYTQYGLQEIVLQEIVLGFFRK